MGKNEEKRSSDRTIERGNRYDHATYGSVEVTDIWQGTQWTGTATLSNELDEQTDRQSIIVRFIPADDGDWTDEIAETRATFRDAVN